jgi:hypothetical protein
MSMFDLVYSKQFWKWRIIINSTNALDIVHHVGLSQYVGLSLCPVVWWAQQSGFPILSPHLKINTLWGSETGLKQIYATYSVQNISQDRLECEELSILGYYAMFIGNNE